MGAEIFLDFTPLQGGNLSFFTHEYWFSENLTGETSQLFEETITQEASKVRVNALVYCVSIDFEACRNVSEPLNLTDCVESALNAAPVKGM